MVGAGGVYIGIGRKGSAKVLRALGTWPEADTRWRKRKVLRERGGVSSSSLIVGFFCDGVWDFRKRGCCVFIGF